MGLNDFLTTIKHHPKNVFSTTRGLRFYEVSKEKGIKGKRFSPTIEGYRKANLYASKLFKMYKKSNIHYVY